MARIFLLGIISGFPWVLIGSSLTLWLQEEGLSRTAIGWSGLIFTVYAVNFCWAPLIDRIRIPILARTLGHRRAWIIPLQLVILLAVLTWSGINPSADLGAVIAIGLLIAIASATMDIVIDALRIEQFDRNESEAMTAGAAMATIGWWTGYQIGGAVALRTADSLQSMGVEGYWPMTFILLGAVIVLCTIGLLFVRESKRAPADRGDGKAVEELSAPRSAIGAFVHRVLSWLTATFIAPMSSFFRRNGFTIALSLLGFIFLFKIGESFLGRMSLVFYSEIGFTKSQIAFYSKTIGWVITVLGTLIGSLLAIRIGLVRAMFFAGMMMALTNLLFAQMAWVGKSESLFAFAVIADGLTAAFATVTFVAFISMLVDRNYTATQYALLASIGNAGRTTFAGASGAFVDWLNGDWGTFFVITTLMVMPSLICLWIIRHRLADILSGATVQLFGKKAQSGE
ncbi:MAG: MFS transporter [Ectothiorhodospiraceae bacterium AqS1]|nr:MFS transporter [Ectothiorhodospiraceae bacterium AqS1]